MSYSCDVSVLFLSFRFVLRSHGYRDRWQIFNSSAIMLPISLHTLCCLFFSYIPDVVALSLTSTGGTLMLGDVPYYVPATPYTTISANGLGRLDSVNGLAPVTVVSVTAGNDSVGSLGSIVGDFAADDVWNTGFLEGRSSTPHRKS